MVDRWKNDDERGRPVHPRLHIILHVLDRDCVPGIHRRDEVEAPAVRGGPAGVRPEPEAGGLAVHAAGAGGHDREVDPEAAQRSVLPHRCPLHGVHHRVGAGGRAPRGGQVACIDRSGKSRVSINE